MISEDFLQSVRDRKVHDFGNIIDVSDYDWYRFVKLIATHPNRNVVFTDPKQRVEIKECVQRPALPRFAKNIILTLNETFYDPGNVTTLVILGGFDASHKSFGIHKDVMDVFYVQVLGEINWSIWETDSPNPRIEESEGKQVWKDKFTPGRAIWIPRGTFHNIEPLSARVGFSFAIEKHPDPSTYI